MAILWQVYMIVRVVMGAAAMVMNLLTLGCVLAYSYLRTSANVLVVSIALSDFLHGVLTGVLLVSRHHASSWYVTHVMCMVGLCIETTTVYCQVASFCMLALERRNSLLVQLNKGSKWSFRGLIVLLASLWTLIATFNVVVTILSSDVPEGTVCTVISYFPVYYKYIGIGIFLIACLVIPLAYGSIAWIAHSSSLQVAAATAPTTAQENKKNDMKITKMMAMVVGVFYVLYCPFFITAFTMTPTSPTWHRSLFYVSILIYDINFWINPFIYAWRDKGFKKAFHQTAVHWRLVCRCSPQAVGPSGAPHGALQVPGAHMGPSGAEEPRVVSGAVSGWTGPRHSTLTRLVPREP